MRDTPAKFPIRTNNGRIASASIVVVSKALAASDGTAPRGLIAQWPPNPTSIIAVATGIRSANSNSRTPRPMRPISIFDIGNRHER